MTVHYKTQGFVFKKEDRMEADRVFSVFTRDYGRLEVTGRAIRKVASKLRSGMELFYLSDIEFIQGKHTKTLTDAICAKKFGGVVTSPEKSEIAHNISQLLDDFIKGEQKDEKILELATEVFSILHQEAARQLIYYYFFWNFVSLLGYAPDVSEMPKDVADMIALITKRDWNQLTTVQVKKETQQSLKETSERYYHYLLEHIR